MARDTGSNASRETMLAVFTLCIVLMVNCTWLQISEPFPAPGLLNVFSAPQAVSSMPSSSIVKSPALSSPSASCPVGSAAKSCVRMTDIPAAAPHGLVTDVTYSFLSAASIGNMVAAVWLPTVLVCWVLSLCMRIQQAQKQLQETQQQLLTAQAAARSAQTAAAKQLIKSLSEPSQSASSGSGVVSKRTVAKDDLNSSFSSSPLFYAVASGSRVDHIEALRPVLLVLQDPALVQDLKGRKIAGIINSLQWSATQDICMIVGYDDNPLVQRAATRQGKANASTPEKKEAKQRSTALALVLLYHLSASEAARLVAVVSGAVVAKGFAAALKSVHDKPALWAVCDTVCERCMRGERDRKNREAAACVMASLLLAKAGVKP